MSLSSGEPSFGKLPGQQFQASDSKLLHILLALLASCSLVQAASSLTLEWDPSPDTNVVGYILYHGAVGGNAIYALETGNRTTATVTDLFEGTTNYFFVVAFDAQLLPSAPSNPVVVEVPGTYFPPTISAIADQIIGVDTATETISFTIGDAQMPAARLGLSAASSNPDLVPEADIVFDGSDSDRSVTVTPAFARFGSTTITLTVDDGIATASTSFLLTVKRAKPSALLYLPFEAESATFDPPMSVFGDPNAAGGGFVVSTDERYGTATFGMEIPFFSSCVVWCRVRSLDSTDGAFIVSADDGRDDIFDFATGDQMNGWQWAVVNGRGGLTNPRPDGASPINPRVFAFRAGHHNITFQTYSSNAAIDQILVTNDPDYIPSGMVPQLFLSVPPDQTIDESTTLVLTNTATDSDLSAYPLTYALAPGAPAGATIDPDTGVFTWTPTEAQGPSNNRIIVRVTDSSSPPLNATRRVRVVVREINSAPDIDLVPPQTVRPGSLLSIPISASDPDIPRNGLTFTLGPDAPAGASIEPVIGVFTWKPTARQADRTYTIRVQVTDDGSPSLSDSTAFSVSVEQLSPISLTSVSMTQQEFRLRATGDPGISYSLEASTDFETWVSLGNLESPRDSFEWVDTNAAAFPFRFYRVVAEPAGR